MRELLCCEKAKGGVYLRVKLVPKSSKNEVVSLVGDRVKVTVRAIPQNGQANEALEDTIAAFLDLKRSCCSVISGYKSSSKTVFIETAAEDKIKEKFLSLED
ncbi:MAG: DUF167 family protein [Holosporaceae bacterium]|jgi:uncharacterized protein (TIGR00251 family)|nr:DUF167 family protein [Holosporaceae bacterium]